MHRFDTLKRLENVLNVKYLLTEPICAGFKDCYSLRCIVYFLVPYNLRINNPPDDCNMRPLDLISISALLDKINSICAFSTLLNCCLVLCRTHDDLVL